MRTTYSSCRQPLLTPPQSGSAGLQSATVTPQAFAPSGRKPLSPPAACPRTAPWARWRGPHSGTRPASHIALGQCRLLRLPHSIVSSPDKDNTPSLFSRRHKPGPPSVSHPHPLPAPLLSCRLWLQLVATRMGIRCVVHLLPPSLNTLTYIYPNGLCTHKKHTHTTQICCAALRRHHQMKTVQRFACTRLGLRNERAGGRVSDNQWGDLCYSCSQALQGTAVQLRSGSTERAPQAGAKLPAGPAGQCEPVSAWRDPPQPPTRTGTATPAAACNRGTGTTTRWVPYGHSVVRNERAASCSTVTRTSTNGQTCRI